MGLKKVYGLAVALVLLLLIGLSACGDNVTVTVPAAAITTAPATTAAISTIAPATTAPVATTVAGLPTLTKAPVSNPAITPTATVVDAPTMTAVAKSSSPSKVASGPGKIVYESVEPLRTIYAVNPDGTGKTKLADGSSPVLSPDGKRVAYVKVTSGEVGTRPFKSVIEVMNLDGSGKQEACALKDNYVAWLVRWSPRERYIAYLEAPSNTDAVAQLRLCSPTDKQNSEVKRTQGQLYGLYDWSPDGNNAIWLAGPNANALNLYYGDPDKGGQGAVELAKNQHRMPENPFFSGYYSARFSPDGKTIAIDGDKLFFVSVPGQKSPLEGKTIELPPGVSLNSMAFSPDGKTLAVIMFSSAGYPNLKLIDLGDKDFGKISDPPNGPYRANYVDWSRQ